MSRVDVWPCVMVRGRVGASGRDDFVVTWRGPQGHLDHKARFICRIVYPSQIDRPTALRGSEGHLQVGRLGGSGWRRGLGYETTCGLTGSGASRQRQASPKHTDDYQTQAVGRQLITVQERLVESEAEPYPFFATIFAQIQSPGTNPGVGSPHPSTFAGQVPLSTQFPISAPPS